MIAISTRLNSTFPYHELQPTGPAVGIHFLSSQSKVEDLFHSKATMGSLPVANGTAFRRPPLYSSEPNGQQNGISVGNSNKICSLLHLVDFNAFHNPELVFCLQESKDGEKLRRITYKELAQAVGRCTGWLNHQNIEVAPRQQKGEAPRVKPAPVALLMSSDITLFIYMLALMRLGVPVHLPPSEDLSTIARDWTDLCQVALFSARLSPSAIAHLIHMVEASSIIITSHTSRSAKAAIEIVEKDGLDPVPCIQSAPFESFLETKQPVYDFVPAILPIVDELDRNVIILHSSGSTGLPKPIYHTHGYLLNYAKCHKFGLEDDTSTVCTSTLPLFHVSLSACRYSA